MGVVNDLWNSIPPITRTVLLISFSLTVLVSLDICTPFKLYFNYNLIKNKYQFWRIFTSCFYCGEFAVDTIFSFFLLFRYSSMLESYQFRNKAAEFVTFYFFGLLFFVTAAIFFGLDFLQPCLSDMILYYWARKNPAIQINFIEIFHFRAPILPWFLLLMTIVFGYSAKYQIIGILAGHFYFFFQDVLPKIPGLEKVRVIRTFLWLDVLCERLGLNSGAHFNEEDFVFEDENDQLIDQANNDINELPDNFNQQLMND